MIKRFEVSIFSKFRNGFPLVTKDGKVVKFQNGNRIIWSDLKGVMIITLPDGEDIRFCSIRVQSKINVKVECDVDKGKWKIRFPHSDNSGADSPTTVNVTVAPPEGNG